MFRPLPSLLALVLAVQALADPAPVANVQTQVLARRTLNNVFECFGSVVFSPAAVDHLSTLFAAQVDSIAVQKGQHVLKGQALLSLSPEPGVVQSYVQAQNQLVLAKQNLVQQQQLLAAQLATQQAVDDANKSLKDAEQALQTFANEGADKAHLTLTAPFSGTVQQLAVAAGDHASAGTQLMSLAMDARLQAQLQVEPQDAPRLHPGLSVRLGDVFSAGDQDKGTIDIVAHQVDPTTHKINVIVRLASNSTMLAGTPVHAHITVSSESVLAVPRAALLNDTRGSFIYVVAHGKAHRIPVQAGRESSGWIGISGDVSPGMHVVVLGNYELQEGMQTQESLLP